MTATAEAADRLDSALLKVAAALILGAMAALLDTTIVNVAVAALGRALHATVTATFWWALGLTLLAVPFALQLPARPFAHA